ncbi:MAG: methionine--tRNA ligase [Deltaproteobacteria bacterium]|nr:methionine--tRNA ligase [Deltaproteobacteria bacterium]
MAPDGTANGARRVYVTTPLYYVNAEPHLGSAYTSLICDTIARFYRQRGYDTYFLTGTDEHGDKIAEAAAAAGEAPKAYTDRISGIFRSTWEASGLTYDRFIRTTDADHVRTVQEILQRVYDAGDIYFGSYGGLYCTGCERFYTEKELVDGKCPDHKTVPDFIEEENYFFRMGKYQERLLAAIEAKPALIRPERYRNEVLAMLREPLEDLCISRPKSRLTWGIAMPFDARFVTYVWFDALINYVTAVRELGPERFRELWPAAQHFIAKDILKPHAVYWPTMLMAAGLPLYDHLNVHGYWTVDGQKMSKSLGNVVRPLDMQAKYGRDAFRYVLLRESVFGLDADFREDALVTRINADLANNLGNLVSRTLSMQQKYFAGVVQPLGERRPEDVALAAAFADAGREVETQVADLMLSRALEAILRAADHANKYIVETAPFTLAKDPATVPRVGAILHNLLEALRATAQLAAPFIPETAERIVALLDLPADALRLPGAVWGAAFPAGHAVRKPVPLFPRIEP